MDIHKPFLTKCNPLNIDHNESERFNLKYLLPTYWFTWIGILFSLLLVFTPQAISDEVASNIYDFIVFYILSYMILSFLLLIFGNDIATSFSSVASCLNNLGPAVGDAVNSYSSLSTSSKYVLSFTMILGRLEIYTLLIILTPYFWKY